jgi:hypothetical protein
VSDFTFYATLDADSIRPYIPDVPVLLPASSFARHALKVPNLPPRESEVAVDSGGYVATMRWGDYRYTPDEYTAFCRGVGPSWAAMMDYCCEPEVAGGEGVVLSRQDRTTEMAWRFWLTYRDEPWVWVPTVQGWEVEDYRRHARDLQPLVRAMQAHYGEGSAFRVGIGTLCRRASEGMIRDVVAAVRDVLPGVGLHLWGVKLGLLKSAGGTPPGVVSVDSAAWNGLIKSDKERLGYLQRTGTQREYAYGVALPDYLGRLADALASPRTLPMLCAAGGA